MGNYHENITKDYEQMEKYYLMAVENYNVDAMYSLAIYHQDITKDYQQMEKYYLMAIDGGDIYSMIFSIRLFLNILLC